MTYAKKVDTNQNDIVKVLRKIGCSVWITSACGHGAPDLVLGMQNRNILVELKDGAKPPSQRKLTPAEAKFHDEWKGELYIINNENEAIELVNRIRRECDDFKMLQGACECNKHRKW